MNQIKTIFIICSFSIFVLVSGHGVIMEPVGRASRWRTNSSAPVNYNDCGNYCGGFSVC